MNFAALASNLFSAIGNFFSYQLEKLKLKNAPEIKRNVEAKADVEIKDESTRIVDNATESKDLNEIRKAASE